MDKKSEIRKLYCEAFDDADDYVDMYFKQVYRDDEALYLTSNDGKLVSSLFLKRYKMNFCGEDCDISYIAGAATSKRFRGQGFMKTLLKDALRESYLRGDMFSTLIPAHRWLYEYYDKVGFSTVFYIEEQRYTSLHSFNFTGDYQQIEDVSSNEVYRAFDAMMRQRPNCVQHSYNDYLNILADNKMDGGAVVALRERNSQQVAAITFGVMNDCNLVVKDVLAVNEDASNAALSVISSKFPHVSITVITMPQNNSLLPIESRGMARLINVGRMLKSFASAYPSLKTNMRVTDPILHENSHIYFIDNGSCTVNDGFMGRLDLDVTIDVLTSIIFRSEKVGSIFGLPTRRPYMSLMLD